MAASKLSLQKYVFQFDYLLLLFLLATTAYGLVVLYGTTYQVPKMEYFYLKQAMWLGVSLGVFTAALVLPYRWLAFLGWFFYAFSLLLLIVVLFASRYNLGIIDTVRGGGAVKWLSIPLGGMHLRFQPSEFTKIATVIVIAHYMSLRRNWQGNPLECIPALLLMAVPFLLVFKQPDLGTASILVPIPFVILFAGGLRWWIVLSVAAVGLILAVSGTIFFLSVEKVPFLREYQLRRIRVFLEPLAKPFHLPGVEETLYGAGDKGGADKGGGTGDTAAAPQHKKIGKDDDWNIKQAEMALGSGRVFGKGWHEGTQSRYSFLPEHHTDFIFSSLGEQFGLAGCVGLLFMYVLIVWRMLLAAVRGTDLFGKYMCVGFASIFITHAVMNTGMTTRLLPVTGIPLPFISYGGSFLVANYLIMGIVANVTMRRDTASSGGRERK